MVFWSLFQPHDEWCQVPGQLAEWPKASQSWCWPSGEWGWILATLVCGTVSKEDRKAQEAHSCCSLLLEGAVSLHGWLLLFIRVLTQMSPSERFSLLWSADYSSGSCFTLFSWFMAFTTIWNCNLYLLFIDYCESTFSLWSSWRAGTSFCLTNIFPVPTMKPGIQNTLSKYDWNGWRHKGILLEMAWETGFLLYDPILKEE